MVVRRKSHEAGHRRKFLVVVDETPECDRALYFAARRAAHTGGGLVLLTVTPPADFQHWLGVETIMREEAREAGQALLDEAVAKAARYAAVAAETVLREGQTAEQIRRVIEEDEDIAILVLGAATGSEGPGPLVSMLAGAGAAFPIPVTIVPGALLDEELDALS
jgi:nucleotide-binding universal stress UspA family protein